MPKKLKYGELLFPKQKKRPKCPRCGFSNPVSRGVEWGCRNCGRRWAKKANWGKNYEAKKGKEEVD